MDKKHTISLYWKCQLIGWSAAALYWGYQGVSSGHFLYGMGILQFVSDVFFYILITHIYRNFALKHHYQDLSLNQLIKRIISAAIILGIIYTLVTAVKVYFFRVVFVEGYSVSFIDFFKTYVIDIFIAGIRLMSIWLLAYHLYQYAQREIRVTRENARLEIISREAQMNNLSAQLNPHFLFNSLNTIKALVIDNPTVARRSIDLLSDILRTSLYNGDIILVSLQDEISLVKDYLELEKLRFEERLQYTINQDNGISKALIPRFCIQLLVENSIKHGIAKLKDGGMITVFAKASANNLLISVQNPGKLNDEKQPAGVGLKNLRERLELQYKGAASLNMIDEANDTVLVTLTIPQT